MSMKLFDKSVIKNKFKSTSTNPFERVDLGASNNSDIQLRLVEDDDNDLVFIRVSNFEENGTITVYGEYSQNFQNFPSYDLSKVIVLDDISFRFFLSIKSNPNDSKPLIYTSKEFYDDLISTYNEENPYMVQNSVKSEFIVNLDLSGFKNKIEEMRRLELSLPIQELFEGGLLVSKHLFSKSNYSENENSEFGVNFNPTYDIDELVRYVDWVVSKPNSNYDERLLDARTIGEWPYIETEANQPIPEENEPPIEITEETTPTISDLEDERSNDDREPTLGGRS